MAEIRDGWTRRRPAKVSGNLRYRLLSTTVQRLNDGVQRRIAAQPVCPAVGVQLELVASVQAQPPVAPAPTPDGGVPEPNSPFGTLNPPVPLTASVVPSSVKRESVIEFAPFALGNEFVVREVDVVLPEPLGVPQLLLPEEIPCEYWLPEQRAGVPDRFESAAFAAVYPRLACFPFNCVWMLEVGST